MGQMCYRWPKEYGGVRIDLAKDSGELELEPSRSKKVVADPSLYKAVVKEAPGGIF